MDFSLRPALLLDPMTLHIVVAVTFLIQSLIIAFHVPLRGQFPGVRTFLFSALVLAAGSIVLMFQAWFHPGLLAFVSSVLLIGGAALQYLALVRFLNRTPPWWFVGGWTALAILFLLIVGWMDPRWPMFSMREVLPIPFLVAAAAVILRSDNRRFQTGAMLTALPFAGYAVRSALRFVAGVFDQEPPGLMGPNENDAYDALAVFVFSFLWTSGFLLMANQNLQSALSEQASIDAMTQSLNRRAMTEKLEEEHLRYERYGRPYTIVLLDVDRFKQINDTHGHHEGDRVLGTLAKILKESLRSGDSLARWGGEEFLILLPETGQSEGRTLAERMRLMIKGYAFELPGRDVTFSAGVAEIAKGQSVDDLCRRADQALYQAKTTRNCVVEAG